MGFIRRRSQHGGRRVNRRMTGTVRALPVWVRRPGKKKSGSRVWNASLPAKTAHWPKPQRFWFSEKRRQRSGGTERTHDQHPTSPNNNDADRRCRYRRRAARQGLCRAGNQRSHRKAPLGTGISAACAIIRCSSSTSSGTSNAAPCAPATSTAPAAGKWFWQKH